MKNLILLICLSFSSLVAKVCSDYQDDMINQLEKTNLYSEKSNNYQLRKLEAISKKTMRNCKGKDNLNDLKEARVINKLAKDKIKYNKEIKKK
jgi:hypothetical protein